MRQHGPYHVVIALWLHYGEQGVQRPVGVPQGKCSIIGESIGLVGILIKSFVTAVHIHIYRWTYKGMVHSRVKVYLLIRILCSNGYFIQLLVPLLFSLLIYLIKIPSRCFGS